MRVSLVISTYNNPESLRKCLLGVCVQERPPDEIIVADDGSTDDTAAVLRRGEFSSLPIRHVWHADHGWRKSKVLNLAIASSTGDYVVFIDGDCVPRRDYVASHLRHARPRTFLSGNLVRVPAELHVSFTDDEILENAIFDSALLERRWPEAARYRRQLDPGWAEPLLNLLTWRYCVLMGGNCSAWRDDLVAVNGLDEGFAYGKEDRELGVRLRNSGVGSRWLKYSLILIHLDHPRTPVDLDRYREQRKRLRRLWFNGATWIEPGIETAFARNDEKPATTHGLGRTGSPPTPEAVSGTIPRNQFATSIVWTCCSTMWWPHSHMQRPQL
ncbi:MAG: glycosyltransferase [Planctomycetia bacterium]